jgi:threonine/homoserine/homoserine lactone efflux protein
MSYLLTLGGVAAIHLMAAASPGPAFVMVTRVSMAESRAAALGMACGVANAAVLWAVAASLGVGALLSSAAILFTALKLAGGTYLLWLGLLAWRGAGATGAAGPGPVVRQGMRPARAWWLGLSTNLSNPKVIIFFGSIFVALFAPGTPGWVRVAALAIVAVNETLWYILVALLFSAAPVQRAYRRVRGWVERIMGTVMLLFGARLILAAV